MVALRASSRSAVLPLVAAAGTVGILYTYNAHYPVKEWLLLRVLGYWTLSLYWALGCTSLGLWLVGRVAPRRYHPLETFVLGFSVGVMAFAASVLLFGLAHALGKPFFFLAPAVFILTGRRVLAAFAARGLSRWRAFAWSPSALELLALAGGAVGLVAVYIAILTPHNVQHDARWYHLPIAQQYASQGAVARFPEGWLLGAYPHLASYLYTWAMLMPAGIVARLELAAHMEFIVFLVTIAATPALLRRVLPGKRVPMAWAGFFLFPGFLVYDSNLSTGADHIAALFAAAGMIALFPALATLGVAHCALVGVAAAGALSTKYSAISVVVPLLGLVFVRAVWHAHKTDQNRRAGFALLALFGAFVAAWSPHWLPNLVWYGDPVYPMLHDQVTGHPWDAEADMYFRVFMQYAIMKPTHDLAGVFDTLRAAATLGFRAYETGFHGELPTFGFLFAATLYCLPFTRPSWRSLVAHGLGFAAALVWYWTNHRDRYLQACLPWLVVATLAVLVTLWNSTSVAARASAAALVVAQLVCGAGAYLLPSHFMIPDGHHPLTQVMAMLEAGRKGQYAVRDEPFKEWRFAAWTKLGQLLPRDARVLVHEDRLWVGLDRPVVVDEAQWQAGIRYGSMDTPAQVYKALHGYAVTHVVTGENHSDGGDHGISGNLVFWEFVHSYTKRLGSQGGLTLWQMPDASPPPATMGRSLILTCNQSLPSGLFDFAGIRPRRALLEVPAKSEASPELLERADYVVLEEDCGYSVDTEALAAFEPLTTRGHVTYYRRTESRDRREKVTPVPP